MTCTHPIEAWRGDINTKTGKRSVVFREKHAKTGETLWLPCGQCIHCRLRRSLEWAIRLVHEADIQKRQGKPSMFLTLTYNDENLPQYGDLKLRDVQLFLKRLRKHISPNKIKYYLAAEYGEKFSRPHYHLILYGYQFPDIELISQTGSGTLYQSDILENLWGKGFCTIGNVTLESAAYCARYCLKKINGVEKEDHYQRVTEYGELISVEPEFSTCSNGIGKGWYEKFKSDCFPHEYVMIKKALSKAIVKAPVPRYYKKLFEQDTPDEFWEMVETREPPPITPDERLILSDWKRVEAKDKYRLHITKTHTRDFEKGKH